jgi:peptidyl-prolyl cis-trans isomerase B (cyclophilin B)
MMKRVLLLALALILMATIMSSCTKQAEQEEASLNEEQAEPVTETVVTLQTNRGDITLRFFPDKAPEHVKNFIGHSKNGLYKGCLFHRVIPGFMIQGGDPNSKDTDPNNDGMGGYSYKGEGIMLDAEFNLKKHSRGILSMARSQSPNSAGSQFFLMHADSPFLDGKYTVFGEIIDGIEVVDLIVSTPRSKSDRPNESQRIDDVIIGEWDVEKIEAAKTAMWKEDKARTTTGTPNTGAETTGSKTTGSGH